MKNPDIKVFYKGEVMTIRELMVKSKTTLHMQTVINRIKTGIPAEEAVKKKDPSGIIGVRFGRWTVESFAEVRNYDRYWIAVCDCGKRRAVREANLISNKSASCGCLLSDVMHDAVRQMWIRRREAKQESKCQKKSDKVETSANKCKTLDKAGISRATYYAALAKAGKSPKYKLLNKEARKRREIS